MSKPQFPMSSLLKYVPIITSYLLIIVLIFTQEWDISVFVWNQVFQVTIILVLLSLKFFFVRLDKSWNGRPSLERFLGRMWVPLILALCLGFLLSNLGEFNINNPLTVANQAGLLISTSIFALSQLLSSAFIMFWKATDQVRGKILFREIVGFAGRWTFVFILAAFASGSFAAPFGNGVIMVIILLAGMLYEIYFTRLLQKGD